MRQAGRAGLYAGQRWAADGGIALMWDLGALFMAAALPVSHAMGDYASFALMEIE